MKQILLSEGKYDVFLLEEFFREYDCCLDTFVREELEVSGHHRTQQTNKIRSFIESRSPYNVLIKSEGGKKDLLNFFSTEVRYLVEEIKKVVLVIDLDSDDEEGLGKLKEKLSEKIEDRHSGSGCEVILNDPIKRNEYLVALEGCIHLRDSLFGKFFVIGLKPNLEDIAGIDREENNKETKREKIKRLLDNDRISNFLEEVLTGDVLMEGT